MNSQAKESGVILGVDTHLDTHVDAIVDQRGQLLGTYAVPTTSSGYLKLLAWGKSFGILCRAGVEGTGTYSVGLARVLWEHRIEVLKVNCPDRARRRLKGKSDPTDAENAARAVLSCSATAILKLQSGASGALRTISVARRSAVKAKTQAINQLRSILFSAPQDIRERLWRTKPNECVVTCASIRSLGTTALLQKLTSTLKLLAKRWRMLAAELKELDDALESLTSRSAKRLRQQFGVGPQTAATLMAVAGDNPERLRSEAALAALSGASPLQASSAKTTRHRLNRGDDRPANNALWTIAMVRMRSDPKTRAYVEHRTAQGMSSKEIQRCLKRYIARELYPLLLTDLPDFEERA